MRLGVYDSGVGGISLLGEILMIHPELSYVYWADCEILPLGDKTVPFIQERVLKIINVLIDTFECDCVLIACNTASIIVNTMKGIEDYVKKGKIIVISRYIIEYVVKEYSDFKFSKGLVFSTEATHRSGYYQYEMLKNGFLDCQSLPNKYLASAVEFSHYDEIYRILTSNAYNNGILPERINYVLLGCTHYSWVYNYVQQAFPQARIIDPNHGIAQRLITEMQLQQSNVSPVIDQQVIYTGSQASIETRLVSFFHKLNYNISPRMFSNVQHYDFCY